MSPIYYYSPGSQATIFFETLDAAGARSDGYGVIPSITRILFPDLTIAVGFPQNMTKIDTGLFRYVFTLPTGSSGVGSYLVDISYQDPADFYIKSTFRQIVVTSPAGAYSISTV